MIWELSSPASIAGGTDTDFTRNGKMEHAIIQDMDWAEKRGLDVEKAAMHGLTTKNGMIGFQYVSGNQMQFTKWRTADKSRWMIEPQGKPMCFFNVDCLRDYQITPENAKTPLIITEGELDALSAIQAGFQFVVSVPTGANGFKSEGEIIPENDNPFSFLWDVIEKVDQFHKVILFTDNDEKGLILRDELAVRIGRQKCFYIPPREGLKDANDYLIRFGEQGLKDAIEKSAPLVSDKIVGLYDLPPEPDLPQIKTGWEELNAHCLLTRPSFVVITGEPGTGKSQFARALGFHLSLGLSREEFKTGNEVMKGMYFTLEDPAKRLQRDAYHYMKGIGFQTNDREKQQRIRDVLSARIKVIKRTNKPLTLAWAAEKMEMAAVRHDCQYVVLDPWNEIEHVRGNKSETEYIGDAIRTLKRVCQNLGLMLIVVAHPTKPDGYRKTVDLYSIAGSANWYNKSDHGIVLTRPKFAENLLKVDIQKCKDWETMGSPGCVYMRFERDKKDFNIVPGDEVAELKQDYEDAGGKS